MSSPEVGRIGIIGAGVAGLSCAAALTERGFDVVLFDKGRGPGGRLSTRRVETPLGRAAFDHGAQYFTVRDEEFGQIVEGLARAGEVARWPAAGADAWVGTPAMNAVVKAMAVGRDVRWAAEAQAIHRAPAGWMLHLADGVVAEQTTLVLAVPAEQAAALLADIAPDMSRHAAASISQPCWTGMFVFPHLLPTENAVLRGRGALAWAARNSAKPGRQGPEAWVVQAGPDWSRARIEDSPEAVAADLLLLLGQALGIALPPPVSALAHRWRFANSRGTGAGALWDGRLRLGVCGDWLLGARIECAWRSGRRLGQTIANGNPRAAP